MAPEVTLREPTLDLLPGYVAALRQGWSPDNVRLKALADEELALISEDARGFVDRQVDREATGGPVRLPDGSMVARLPGYRMWIFDGEFCGIVGLRWQPGTPELPPHVLGHIGYAVVPWKRGRGIATAALRLMLGHARGEGLPYVELTTDADNIASQRVILANAGELLGTFLKPAQFGGHPSLRYRIALA